MRAVKDVQFVHGQGVRCQNEQQINLTLLCQMAENRRGGETMVNSFIMRTGAKISLKKKDEKEYVKMGVVEKVHMVETGFILELEGGNLMKVKTKEPKPKDPDASPKSPKSPKPKEEEEKTK